MLAEAHRIAGQTALMNAYRDAASQFPSVLPGYIRFMLFPLRTAAPALTGGTAAVVSPCLGSV